MDPSIEAVLIRTLTEYDWDENAPPKEQITAYAAYCKAVSDCSKVEFSTAGVRLWNESLEYSEQFDSLADARRFVRQAMQSLSAWGQKA